MSAWEVQVSTPSGAPVQGRSKDGPVFYTSATQEVAFQNSLARAASVQGTLALTPALCLTWAGASCLSIQDDPKMYVAFLCQPPNTQTKRPHCFRLSGFV